MLQRTQFGNPILRTVAIKVPVRDIKAEKTMQLIANMHYTLTEKKLGVGLAAPQVGEDIAIAVIAVRKSKTRPDIEPCDLVLINPVITEAIGKRVQLWEGCISAGSQGKADLFAKVPRYRKVRVRYYDEEGRQHHLYYEGLQAHIIQHEVDHLNGILFVDRVKDTKTYMTYKEYLRYIQSRG